MSRVGVMSRVGQKFLPVCINVCGLESHILFTLPGTKVAPFLNHLLWGVVSLPA
jgi:hypothetical protein